MPCECTYAFNAKILFLCFSWNDTQPVPVELQWLGGWAKWKSGKFCSSKLAPTNRQEPRYPAIFCFTSVINFIRSQRQFAAKKKCINPLIRRAPSFYLGHSLFRSGDPPEFVYKLIDSFFAPFKNNKNNLVLQEYGYSWTIIKSDRFGNFHYARYARWKDFHSVRETNVTKN